VTDSDAEILRLRQRCHNLEGNEKIMHQLVTALERRVNRNERDVKSLIDEEKIAREVARRVNAKNKLVLSRVQLVGFCVTVCCSVGGLVLGIVAATGKV
jgi:hypothetical protein